MNDLLIKYVRHDDREPFAVVMTNGVDYGVSICHPSDRFSKNTGKEIAKKNMKPLNEAKFELFSALKKAHSYKSRLNLMNVYASLIILEDRAFRYWVGGPKLKEEELSKTPGAVIA